MNIGRMSMQNSQTGLQTVSHNIANKATPGYSRQRVDFVTNPATGHGKTRVGMGARPGLVGRTNNSYLEKQIEKEGGAMHYSEGRAETLARVEEVYNEQVNKGLNKFIVDFFNSFKQLSNNPESLANRTLVKESADNLTKDFQRVNDQLSSIQTDVDFQIVTHVKEINGITKEIADLNERVQQVVMAGGPANDERDRRDLLVKELGNLININYAESDSGLLSITAGSSAVLVSGYSNLELETAGTVARNGKQEGNYDIFYKPTKKGSPVNITNQIKSGKLGGILEVRDKNINELKGKLDHMAYNLSNEVNKAHEFGYNRYNKKGVSFFKKLDKVEEASQNIGLNKAVKDDVGLIAAARDPNSPADNRIANIIFMIQDKAIMEDGASSLDQFYNSTVGQVGIVSGRAKSDFQNQDDGLKQLTKIRESISGVSLDEETTKLINYQKSFDASARLIRAADEMLDTVINLKRY